MNGRSLGHRAPLLWLALPMMAGLAAGRVGDVAPVAWLLAGAAGLIVLAGIACWREPRWFAPALGAAMFLAGAASYALHRPRIAAWDALPPREARASLAIERTFAQKDARKISGLATIIDADEPLRELAGQRVYFSLALAKGEAVPLRSAIVSALGVIELLPRDPALTTFDGYLASAGINFRFTRGRILAETRAASRYRQFCARQAERFSAMLGEGVAAKRPELVAVLRAMLLGQQHELSDEQIDLFRHSGTMHVFSISGLHIAVIAGGLHALLLLIRLPRVARFTIELGALWLYVDITGTAPSAVRAFAMVALVETSLLLRVPRNPLAALTASALLVLIFAPLQMFSASFQMSYGIVAALLLLGLPLAERWQTALPLFRHLPKATWGGWRHACDGVWRGVLAATAIGAAAALVGAVTGVRFFELLTPGALLENLWLIPASTAAILMGFIALLCGLIGFTGGLVLANHAAVLLLWIIEHGVRASVELPGMWLRASFRAEWIGAATLGLLLGVMGWGYARQWQGEHRGFWMPFAVVLVALAFGVRLS